jgi:hypothetical protein
LTTKTNKEIVYAQSRVKVQSSGLPAIFHNFKIHANRGFVVDFTHASNKALRLSFVRFSPSLEISNTDVTDDDDEKTKI